jgi:hypothetical protein
MPHAPSRRQTPSCTAPPPRLHAPTASDAPTPLRRPRRRLICRAWTPPASRVGHGRFPCLASSAYKRHSNAIASPFQPSPAPTPPSPVTPQRCSSSGSSCCCLSSSTRRGHRERAEQVELDTTPPPLPLLFPSPPSASAASDQALSAPPLPRTAAERRCDHPTEAVREGVDVERGGEAATGRRRAAHA